MTAKDKDTIYIDIDDEITGIIDKLRGSEAKVVALVLPKRAAVFQSIVNMKLLKRAADSEKKNMVLITAEAGLLPLAGMAGIHVAKTLTSKPEIPPAPQAIEDIDDAIPEGGEDIELSPDAPIGDLADDQAAAGGVEMLTLDDDSLPPEDAAAVAAAGPKTFEPPAKKKAKNKKLAVPNFERFRLLLIIGGALLFLLIAGLIFATIALPKATISIKTDASNVDANIDVTLSTAAKTLDPDTSTVPAKLATQQKTYTQQVPTTGQKNNGNKASGSVSVTNCSGADVSLPAGTGFSSGGNTYISQSAETIPDSNYKINGECKKDGKATVSIQAQNGGTGYNGANNFTVAGHSNLTATVSSAISGGTDNIVQSVNQNDITNAKNKIAANDSEVKGSLDSQLRKDKYYPIPATFTAGAPIITTSANVGEVATSVTVTEAITYNMFGVHKEDLNTLLDNSIKEQIDTEKQTVLNNGLDQAVYNVNNVLASGAQLSLSTKATVGPDLDIKNIKEQSAGKKAGAIKSQLGNNPDVKSVDVKISPFWVSTAPKKTERIKVVIAKPSADAKASTDAGDR